MCVDGRSRRVTMLAFVDMEERVPPAPHHQGPAIFYTVS